MVVNPRERKDGRNIQNFGVHLTKTTGSGTSSTEKENFPVHIRIIRTHGIKTL